MTRIRFRSVPGSTMLRPDATRPGAPCVGRRWPVRIVADIHPQPGQSTTAIIRQVETVLSLYDLEPVVAVVADETRHTP